MSILEAATLLILTSPAPTSGTTGTTGPAETEEVGVVEHEEKNPTVFPDPAKFSRGFFAEGTIGPGIPIGPSSKALSVAFSLTGRMGYEIRRWLALQVQATGTAAKYDDGVLHGEILQQYYYTGEVRFGIPIRRFLIALQGGAGLYQANSNLLQVAGVAPNNGRFRFAWDASIAFDIHSLSRHFSGGFVATYFGVPQLRNSGLLTLGPYIRFTL